jgi:hypothetical protein
MARSVQDLELCTRTVADAVHRERLHRTEANLLPLPYRETKIPDKLRIGYFVDGMNLSIVSLRAADISF